MNSQYQCFIVNTNIYCKKAVLITITGFFQKHVTFHKCLKGGVIQTLRHLQLERV